MKKLLAKFHEFIVGKEYLDLQKSLKETQRQQERISKAYDLHRYVLRNYGIESLRYLPDPEFIITDTKEITLFNYLQLDSLEIDYQP